MGTPETPVIRRNVLRSMDNNPNDESQMVSMTIGQLKTIIKEQVLEANSSKKILKKDIQVDDKVKSAIHCVVKDLAKAEKNWDFRKGFKEGSNPEHTQEVLLALGNKVGDFDGDMAYKGCRTYFHTLKTKDKRTKENRMERTKKEQRKRQRKSSARVRRRAILNTSKNIDQDDKIKLFSILENNNFISSEESEEVSGSDSDDEKTAQFVRKTLPWRSDYVNQWFEYLDKKSLKKRQSGKMGGAACRPRSKTTIQSSREEPVSPPAFAI